MLAVRKCDDDLDAGVLTGEAGGVAETLQLVRAKGRGASLEIGASWANNSTGQFAVNVDDLVVDQ